MATAVAFLIAQGWASGISVWGVLVVTGIADRTGLTDAPGLLGSGWVLAGASVLLAIELVADKIPYVDSTSDVLQTIVRPAVGAVIGAEWGSVDEDVTASLGAAIGGGSAAISHAVKMSLRAAINASPEPGSNIAVSSIENAALAGVVALAYDHPVEAAILAGLLLLASLILLVIVVRWVRRGLARLIRYEPPPARGPVQWIQQWVLGDHRLRERPSGASASGPDRRP